jgi:hypothetical protein
LNFSSAWLRLNIITCGFIIYIFEIPPLSV